MLRFNNVMSGLVTGAFLGPDRTGGGPSGFVRRPEGDTVKVPAAGKPIDADSTTPEGIPAVRADGTDPEATVANIAGSRSHVPTPRAGTPISDTLVDGCSLSADGRSLFVGTAPVITIEEEGYGANRRITHNTHPYGDLVQVGHTDLENSEVMIFGAEQRDAHGNTLTPNIPCGASATLLQKEIIYVRVDDKRMAFSTTSSEGDIQLVQVGTEALRGYFQDMSNRRQFMVINRIANLGAALDPGGNYFYIGTLASLGKSDAHGNITLGATFTPNLENHGVAHYHVAFSQQGFTGTFLISCAGDSNNIQTWFTDSDGHYQPAQDRQRYAINLSARTKVRMGAADVEIVGGAITSKTNRTTVNYTIELDDSHRLLSVRGVDYVQLQGSSSAIIMIAPNDPVQIQVTPPHSPAYRVTGSLQLSDVEGCMITITPPHKPAETYHVSSIPGTFGDTHLILNRVDQQDGTATLVAEDDGATVNMGAQALARGAAGALPYARKGTAPVRAAAGRGLGIPPRPNLGGDTLPADDAAFRPAPPRGVTTPPVGAPAPAATPAAPAPAPTTPAVSDATSLNVTTPEAQDRIRALAPIRFKWRYLLSLGIEPLVRWIRRGYYRWKSGVTFSK